MYIVVDRPKSREEGKISLFSHTGRDRVNMIIATWVVWVLSVESVEQNNTETHIHELKSTESNF